MSTRREVVERRLVGIPGLRLPMLVERLACGHLVLNAGPWSEWRLCRPCSYLGAHALPPKPGWIVHIRVPAGRSFRSACGRGSATTAAVDEVTCLRCLIRWAEVAYALRGQRGRARDMRRRID